MRHGVHQRLPRAADRPEQAPQASPAPVQMRAAAARASRHDIASIPLAEVTQRRPNRTGLPDGLKTGIETLSGLSMDHVRVHHGSAEPARIGALAHARGADIHLGPGQERHLPHEAWHVVQQAQGRVRPTMQLKRGDALNDDSVLEREADTMGARALRSAPAHIGALPAPMSLPRLHSSPVVQAYQIRKATSKKALLRSQSANTQILPGGKSSPARLTEEPQQTPARKASFRVADDLSMAVQDTSNEPKEFFAKDAVLKNSNDTLEETGSPVRLTKAGGQIIFDDTVLPKLRPERAQNPDNKEFASLWSSICIEIANHVMGNRGNYSEDIVLDSGKSKGSATIKVDGQGSPGINRLAKYMTNQGSKSTNLDSALSAIKPDVLNDRPGKTYGLAAAAGLRGKAKRLGVNEFARPEVGEGFATFSLYSREKDNAPADYTTGVRLPRKAEGVWGYHHAAVVARSLDDDDWMTLENYRRNYQVSDKIDQHILKKFAGAAAAKRKELQGTGKTRAQIEQALLNFLFNRRDVRDEQAALLKQSDALLPTMWFFRMYGSEPGQSFHEEQAKSGGFVNPLTVRIRKNVVGLLDTNQELISKSIDKSEISWSPARAALNTLEADTKRDFATMRANYNGLKDRRTGGQLTAAVQQVDTLYATYLTNSFLPQMANALHAIKRGTLGAKPTTLDGLKAQANSPETLGMFSGIGYGLWDTVSDLSEHDLRSNHPRYKGDLSADRLTSLKNLRAAINDVPGKVT